MNNDNQEFKFHLDDFEGPLDLLLQLIKKAEMNIYDIDIAEITAQYFDFLNKVKILEINLAGDFFVMAANLMEIKAKMLLQKEIETDEEEVDDPREDLVQQLVEYRKYKKASKELRNKEIRRNKFHSKDPMILEPKIENTDISIDLLTRAFNKIVVRNNEQKIMKKDEKIHEWKYSIETQTKFIEDVLSDQQNHEFEEFLKSRDLEKIITNFLVILELLKIKRIKVINEEQDRLYIALVGEDN